MYGFVYSLLVSLVVERWTFCLVFCIDNWFFFFFFPFFFRIDRIQYTNCLSSLQFFLFLLLFSFSPPFRIFSFIRKWKTLRNAWKWNWKKKKTTTTNAIVSTNLKPINITKFDFSICTYFLSGVYSTLQFCVVFRSLFCGLFFKFFCFFFRIISICL